MGNEVGRQRMIEDEDGHGMPIEDFGLRVAN
jgi:hypothetical protein